MEKIDFCCKHLQYDIEDKFCPVVYSKKVREFHINLKQSTGGVRLSHCYHCGKKLPTSLRDEWFDQVEKKLGYEISIDIDKRKIPIEFKSDVWWKKRGL
jgi:hypothetical protein